MFHAIIRFLFFTCGTVNHGMLNTPTLGHPFQLIQQEPWYFIKIDETICSVDLIQNISVLQPVTSI